MAGGGGLTDQREAVANLYPKKNIYAQCLKRFLIEAFVMFEKVRSPGKSGGREAVGLFIFSDICEEWRFLTLLSA